MFDKVYVPGCKLGHIGRCNKITSINIVFCTACAKPVINPLGIKEAYNMVQKLKMDNNKSVNLNLDALGEAATHSVGAEKTETPELLEPTLATVTGITLRVNPELHANREDATKQYQKVNLAMSMRFIHPETGDEVTDKCNYGGIRAYPMMQDGQIITDENGAPIIERFWIGSADSKQASFAAKLLGLAKEFNPEIATYGDFFNFLRSQPKAYVRTITVNYGMEQFKKNAVVEFVE